MRTLHTAYRVADVDRSLAFYGALGFSEVGRVVTADDSLLVLLKLPDDEVVTLELVSRPGVLDIGTGFSHLVVQVDRLETTCAALSAAKIPFESPQHPGGLEGPTTSFIHDPDGYRIELVEWPAGHANGVTEADTR